MNRPPAHGMFENISLHTCDAYGNFNVEIVGKAHTCKAIGDEDSMTQPNDHYSAMTNERITDAYHWIGEVDGIGMLTCLFHIVHDRHYAANTARRMSKPARPLVFLHRAGTHCIQADLKNQIPTIVCNGQHQLQMRGSLQRSTHRSDARFVTITLGSHSLFDLFAYRQTISMLLAFSSMGASIVRAASLNE